MSLNTTPSANRLHIAFFGRRNAGKSSLVNAVTGQELALVSDIAGTTTDPVYKAMELLPLGPVMIIDTAGLDDEGQLGALRVQKTHRVLNKTDIAVLVVSANEGMTDFDLDILQKIKAKQIPYLIAYNKTDLGVSEKIETDEKTVFVSAKTGENINELKELIGKSAKTDDLALKLVGDLLKPSDIAVLVAPIDSSAPKGRLILPQQQAIRDILEANAISVVIRETEIKETLNSLSKKPAMVITDSQAFKKAAADTPLDIPLTSFSILMARFKGFLETAVKGAAAIEKLKDGDAVLISEGCTHHRQCEDIGTVKLPKWLKEHTGKELMIKTTSGTEFPEDLSEYALVIHCGGCMLNEREMKYRMQRTVQAGVPFTNYGTAIAHINGILKRSLEIFPGLAEYCGDRK